MCNPPQKKTLTKYNFYKKMLLVWLDEGPEDSK